MKSQIMKFQLKFAGALALGLMTCFSLTLSVSAQENGNQIEIVDQNGDPVKPAAIRGQARGGAQASGGGGGKASGGGGGSITQGGVIRGGRGGGIIRGGGGMRVERNKDGKIVVTDKDGNRREIDANGAQSIVIRESVESTNNNGEEQTKRVGKAIIIGADGQRHEIDLGGDNGAMPGIFEFRSGKADTQRNNDGFMIGVYCEPVSPALRAHLQLESGLTVVRVTPDSPAHEAGIAKHDILMFVDDRELLTSSDLTEVVQTAGKEKNKVSLTLIRGGKEISVEVAPVERSESNAPLNMMPQMLQVFPEMGKPGGVKMQFRQMGPGIILDKDFGGGFNEDVEKMHQDMEKRMEAMLKRVEELHLQMRQQNENDR